MPLFSISCKVLKKHVINRRRQLIKRFGRLVSVANRVASHYEGISTIDVTNASDTAAAAAIEVIDKEWLLGQARIRCCKGGGGGGKGGDGGGSNAVTAVCAGMLAAVCDYEAVVGIMTLKASLLFS